MRKVYLRLEGSEEEEIFSYDEEQGFPCFISAVKDVVTYWEKYLRFQQSEPIDILSGLDDDDTDFKAHLN